MDEFIIRISDEDRNLLSAAINQEMEHWRPGSKIWDEYNELLGKIWGARNE